LRKSSGSESLGAVDLLEEAVNLLRVAPLRALVFFYAASVPFVLGFIFFGREMGEEVVTSGDIGLWALVLACLLVVMKTGQSLFAADLLSVIRGTSPPTVSWKDWRRGLWRQAAWSSWSWPAYLVALFLVLPLGWIIAFFQGLVAGDGGRMSLRQVADNAARWPRQNHCALGLLLLAALFIWANFLVLFFSVPSLLKSVLGWETKLTENPWSLLNSTTFLATAGLTYLAINPLLKAMYVLRCFYGEAIRTGEDLRVELKETNKNSGMWLCLGAGLALSVTSVGAQTASPLPVAESVTLEQAIEKTLQSGDYQWRYPAAKAVKPAQGSWWSYLEKALLWMEQTYEKCMHWLEELMNKLFPPREDKSASVRSGETSRVGLLAFLLFLVVGLVVGLGWIYWRRHLQQTSAPSVASLPVIRSVDLASEQILPHELPEQEWLNLAEEMIRGGQFRLALRAFYFATLTRMEHQGWIRLARHKSNRDYAGELARRLGSRTEIKATFAESLVLFEAGWYGTRETTLGILEQMASNRRLLVDDAKL
jgi:hypothetical protein